MKSVFYRKFFGHQQNSIKLVTGFTLVETLVAVSILTLAIAGPLAVSSLAISESQHARNQITASYLAQDGIEAMINIRNSNFLRGNDWLSNLDNCLSPKKCGIDSRESPLQVSNCSGSCPKMKYDSASGFYNYLTGLDSIFTREIQYKPIDPNNILVTVSLTWSEKTGEKTYLLKNYLNKLQ